MRGATGVDSRVSREGTEEDARVEGTAKRKSRCAFAAFRFVWRSAISGES